MGREKVSREKTNTLGFHTRPKTRPTFQVGRKFIRVVLWVKRIRHGSVVERRSPELHTDLVRVRASARTEYISVWMMH